MSDEQITDATRRLIRAGGPQVSVEAIAAEVGVSGQAVLKRFGSRNALLIHAFQPPPMPAFLSTIDDGPDDRPFATQLHDLARDLTGLFATQAQDFAILRWTPVEIRESLMPPGTEPAPVVAVRQVTAWLERCTTAGHIRQDVDCEAVALAFLGALQVRAVLEFVTGRPPGHADDATYLATVVELFTRATARPQ
ncbi:TetR/AcrR family transcriptional regulator [Jannaschia sp. R86511]|uniref:TetR/AcrR family transcriptional regulator n=1 Tax=Jannaschia sp. R86511 TaxID=3093853 RepID=UPI0036D228C4